MSSREIMKRALAASVRKGKREAREREIRRQKERICQEKVCEIFQKHPGKRTIDQKNRVMAALLEFGTIDYMFGYRELQAVSIECIAKDLISDGLPVRWTTGRAYRGTLELID